MANVLNVVENSENSLTMVPSDVLHGLNELKILRLNGNTITKIETGAFRDMASLKEIQVI